MLKSQKKKHLFLFFILVTLRKLIDVLQRQADSLEHYMESAGKDTEEITENIQLNNTVRILLGLTVLAAIASLSLTAWTESFFSNLDLFVFPQGSLIPGLCYLCNILKQAKHVKIDESCDKY